MYSQRMYCAQEGIQQNYELMADGSFELRSSPCPLQFFGSQQQPWTPQGVCSDSLRLRQDNMGPAKPPSTAMLSGFESPASAFYTTERCMRFQPYRSVKTSCDSELPLYRSSPENFHISSGNSMDQYCEQDKASCDSYAYPLSQVSFSSQLEKRSPVLASGGNNSTSSSVFPASTGSILPSKTRIRWTPDLHEKFVECVNRLGGSEKATPKAILKLMDSDGLTIFHIKSHLQKYRIAKYIPDSAEGRNERRTSLSEVPRLDPKGCLQIKETLQLQLDVQRQLHEQLEIQRKLQLRIEEQGRQLRMMFDRQKKTAKSLSNEQNETGLEDDQFLVSEGSDKTHFQSKIS